MSGRIGTFSPHLSPPKFGAERRYPHTWWSGFEIDSPLRVSVQAVPLPEPEATPLVSSDSLDKEAVLLTRVSEFLSPRASLCI